VHFVGTLCLDNHKNILKRGYLQELVSVLQISLFDAFSIAFYLFITQTGEEFSGMVILGFLFAILAALYVERVARKKYLLRRKSRKPYFTNHLLVVTHSLIAESVVKRTMENSFGEYEAVGVILADEAAHDSGKQVCGVPVVCAIDEIADYIRNRWIDEVLFHFPKESDIPADSLARCVEMGITVHIGLDFLTGDSNIRIVEKFAGCPVVTESLRIASPRQMFLKRAMDICGAIVGLIVTAFLTVIIGPAIYLSDPGPIFFSQPRIGKNGRVFKLYKFRSMYQDAENRKRELLEKNTMDGFMFKMDDDPRVLGSGSDGKRHGLGWFLRKYSIDEFPQFWNVLRGELSLVGTRPPLLEEWERYEPCHRGRMSVRPGITGLWQVSGRNRIKDFDEVVALDMKYIRTWSVSEDIKIILKTFWAIFSGTGAQ
jgi:exopolysaccharide biosynthesis polyprenyl glycosylphosphotransferase